MDTSKPRNGHVSIPSGRTKGDFGSSGVTESVPSTSVASLAGEVVAKPSSHLRLWPCVTPAHVEDGTQKCRAEKHLQTHSQPVLKPFCLFGEQGPEGGRD